MAKRFFGQGKWARYALLVSIFVTQHVFSDAKSASPSEALMLRRITEYWKDGDYAVVKRQIIDFLEKNPQTALRDHLSAILGDLYFQERNFRQALATYDLIANPEVKEKTFFNSLQAQFELRNYLAVMEQAESFLKHHQNANAQSIKVRYLLAESAFRHALKIDEFDQKVFYLKIAKPHYKILTQTKYSDRALFPLAEIHRLLREDQRAVALYLTLSEKYPQHRERFLFQAAILQIKENKKEAIRTFQQVYEMGGKRSKLAAFNRLILLFQNENYEEFLGYYQKVISQMPEEKVSLLQFYEGRCHYSLGDYSQAIMPLENFVTRTKNRSKELKTALLLLVNCGRYMKDVELLERTLFSFKSTFPRDAEVPTILMIHAQMCREHGNLNQALSDLKMLTAEYPAYEDSEAVMYDYALLLSQMDRHLEAREMFTNFLSKYPESKKKIAAWRHLINCSIEEMKNPAQPASTLAKENFIKVLKMALKEDKILSSKEKELYSLVLIKSLCELGNYEEALPSLTAYIADIKNPSLLSEAYLLLAICEQKMHSDLAGFIQNAEKALSYNPKIPEGKILHLELFNAYLSQGQTVENPAQKNGCYSKAAEHLYASGAWKERAIKLDNYLWLTNYYYNQTLRKNKDAFEKAKVLFTDLLGIEGGKTGLNISADSLYLEVEVIKFAELLGLQNQVKEQIRVLEMLAQKQEEQKQLPWQTKRRVYLELGRAYEADTQYPKALEAYRYLTTHKEKGISLVTNSAELALAKLEYKMMKPGQRKAESPEMISILHTLKDLQIQKKAVAEPIHLEAALKYAEIRTQIADHENEAKNAWFYYKRMYGDFTSKEDPIAQEYNYVLEKNPEKKAIFDAYMQYIQAEMLKCQAIISFEDKKHDQGIQYQEEALTIYNQLLKNENSLRPYLLDRVKRSKAEIVQTQSLSYQFPGLPARSNYYPFLFGKVNETFPSSKMLYFERSFTPKKIVRSTTGF